MPKKIIAVLLSVLVIVTAFALPTFAAEDEAAAAPSVDWSKYPTMNLITFPYVNSTVSNGGLNWSVQDDFGVAVKGEITGYSQFILAEIPLASDTIYTFNLGRTVLSCGITAEIILLDSLGVSVSKIYVSLQREFVSFSSADYDNVVSARISLLRQSSGLSTNVVDCVIYPMFNVGSEPYPFSPYMPYLLGQQYNNGYASGETAGNKAGYDQGYLEGNSAGIIQGTTEGYKDGYQAAVDVFSGDNLNPFSVCTLVGQVTIPGTTYEKELEIYPVLTSDGAISINDCVDLIKNHYTSGIYEGTDLTNAKYRFHFSWLQQSENVGAFFCDSPIFAYRGIVGKALPGMLYGTNWGYLNGEYTSYSGSDEGIVTIGPGQFCLGDWSSDGFTLSDFRLRFTDTSENRAADLYIYPLRSISSPQYNVGYSQGFLDGQVSSSGDAGKVFYDQGYSAGFASGKQEGLTIADSGDWRHLMLAVTEAPINTFQSLFNFEILGMDMRAAFGSILAVCVVLLIVKKVIF